MVKAQRPADLGDALRLMAAQPTLVLAGGTELMVRYKAWSGVAPRFDRPVIFINHLPEMKGVTLSEGGLLIGSTTTLADILNHPQVPDHIKRPINAMASPPIRNLATLGGNICNASPAADSLPMLYALDARLHLQSAQGGQVVPIKDFITGPGQTILTPEQLLTRIEIPLVRGPSLYYRKVGQRQANSISKLSFYAIAGHDQDRLEWVRIALGAVAPVVVRNPAAEALLAGRTREQLGEVVPAVIHSYQALLRPVDDVRSTRWYRQQVALALLQNYLDRELMR